jgi:hypothetical protein
MTLTTTKDKSDWIPSIKRPKQLISTANEIHIVNLKAAMNSVRSVATQQNSSEAFAWGTAKHSRADVMHLVRVSYAISTVRCSPQSFKVKISTSTLLENNRITNRIIAHICNNRYPTVVGRKIGYKVPL